MAPDNTPASPLPHPEPMPAENYVGLAMRTDPTPEGYELCIERFMKFPYLIHLLHSVLGIATEAGELADIVKRAIFYGKEIDWVHVTEELGDTSWYTAKGMNILERETGTTPTEVLITNIRKLQARFPDKFDETAALLRDVANERLVLESSGKEVVELEPTHDLSSFRGPLERCFKIPDEANQVGPLHIPLYNGEVLTAIVILQRDASNRWGVTVASQNKSKMRVVQANALGVIIRYDD